MIQSNSFLRNPIYVKTNNNVVTFSMTEGIASRLLGLAVNLL